jgi:hypothetical protein
MSASAVRLFVAVATLCAAACAMEGRPCGPDDYEYCDCPSGSLGYAQCAPDGSGYGSCDCSGKIPEGAGILVDAGAPDADAAGTDAGLASFLAPCTDDSDCETHLCFPFNAFGPHCTLPCEKDSDCPPPSSGCSGMGVCKVN